MNLTVKDVKELAVSLFIVSGAVSMGVYVFTSVPDFKHSHSIERQETLEDRAENSKRKTTSLTNMRQCYTDAESVYSKNWSKSCTSYTNQKINDCVINGVPESVCSNKIKDNPECELPSHKAELVQKYEDDAKSSCRLMFEYEMRP